MPSTTLPGVRIRELPIRLEKLLDAAALAL
jgi:hypothetical protein